MHPVHPPPLDLQTRRPGSGRAWGARRRPPARRTAASARGRASGSLSGYGAHTWLARSTYQAPSTVRRGPIRNPAPTMPTAARRNSPPFPAVVGGPGGALQPTDRDRVEAAGVGNGRGCRHVALPCTGGIGGHRTVTMATSSISSEYSLPGNPRIGWLRIRVDRRRRQAPIPTAPDDIDTGEQTRNDPRRYNDHLGIISGNRPSSTATGVGHGWDSTTAAAIAERRRADRGGGAGPDAATDRRTATAVGPPAHLRQHLPAHHPGGGRRHRGRPVRGSGMGRTLGRGVRGPVPERP